MIPSMWSRSIIRCGLQRGFCTAASVKADIQLVSKLRKETGFPLGKCKEALLATKNNFSEAHRWLLEQQQKLGWAKVQKLSSRSTLEGLVGLKKTDSFAALVEVKCETDFVARNDTFKQFVAEATKAGFLHASKRPTKGDGAAVFMLNVEELLQLPIENGSKTLQESLVETVGKLSENIFIANAVAFQASNGGLGSFVHDVAATVADDSPVEMGKIAGVVSYKVASNPPTKMEYHQFKRNLAQHVVGFGPKKLKKESLAPGQEEGEALFSQKYLFDGTPISNIIQEESTRLGTPIDVDSFLVLAIGNLSHDSKLSKRM